MEALAPRSLAHRREERTRPGVLTRVARPFGAPSIGFSNSWTNSAMNCATASGCLPVARSAVPLLGVGHLAEDVLDVAHELWAQVTSRPGGGRGRQGATTDGQPCSSSWLDRSTAPGALPKLNRRCYLVEDRAPRKNQIGKRRAAVRGIVYGASQGDLVK